LNNDPCISVIVPVYNGGRQLGRCLDALLTSSFPASEIIVVDDASTDGSAAVSRARGIEVIQLTQQSGPAAARNCGARHASGNILLFVDADVVVRGDTLGRVVAHFRARPEIAAVFGSYDDAPAETNFVSQYKNLQHHLVHQRSSSEAATFWAGCGAVRREAFESVGGFDAKRYSRPSVEDIELGYRLRRRGFEIVLDRGLQVKHLKRWTFFSLLRTDIFNRALLWSRLVLEEDGMINDLNLRVSDRISAALTGLAVASLILSPFASALLPTSLASLGAVFLLNFGFYSFFNRRRGVWFSAGAFAMLTLYYFYSGTVFTLCYGAHMLRRARGIAPTPGASATELGRIGDA
jgi:GT2 family glycosyltransferase